MKLRNVNVVYELLESFRVVRIGIQLDENPVSMERSWGRFGYSRDENGQPRKEFLEASRAASTIPKWLGARLEYAIEEVQRSPQGNIQEHIDGVVISICFEMTDGTQQEMTLVTPDLSDSLAEKKLGRLIDTLATGGPLKFWWAALFSR